MPERYDDRRNRERDREHRRDHDNHSGYGSMYDRGYDYAGSAEDHGRGRLRQAGPEHHDADWGRRKAEQERRFDGQQQHGGYGQDERYGGGRRDARPAEPRFDDARREGWSFAGAHGQRGFRGGYPGGGYGSELPSGGDVYGAHGDAGRERFQEGGWGRDQNGGYERGRGEGYSRHEGWRADRGDDAQGYGRNEPFRGDDESGFERGMRRAGEQVRSFFDRHSGEHRGEHRNRMFGDGRDDDTGWNDRVRDARTEGSQYGHRREGLWGERREEQRLRSGGGEDREQFRERRMREWGDDSRPNDRDRWFDRRS